MTLTVAIENFKCHIKYSVSFTAGQLMLIKGHSGAGKTTILRAIAWCLYKKELAVYHFDHKNITTTVTLSWTGDATDRWTISRSTAKGTIPMRVTVSADGAVLEGEAADAYIVQRFGTSSVWTMACIQRLSVPNLLMQKNQKEKSRIIRELAFDGRNSENDVAKCLTEAKDFEQQLKAAQGTLESVEQARSRSGVAAPLGKDIALSYAEVEAEVQRMRGVVGFIQTARAALAKANREEITIRGSLAGSDTHHNNFTRIGEELGADWLAGFDGSIKGQQSYPQQWGNLHAKILICQQTMQKYMAVTTDRRAIEEQIAGIHREEKLEPFLEMDLPSLVGYQASTKKFQAQQTLCARLCLPTGEDMTATHWDRAVRDLSTWHAQKPRIEEYLCDKEASGRESSHLRLQLTEHALPTILAKTKLSDLEEMQSSLAVLSTQLKKVGISVLQTTDLHAIIAETISSTETRIEAHEQAELWAKAQAIFLQVKELKAVQRQKEVDPSAWKCPACNISICLKDGTLIDKQHATCEDEDTLKAEVQQRKEDADARNSRCNQLIAEVRSMKLNKEYKDELVLTPDAVYALRAEIALLNDAMCMDVTVALPMATKKWLMNSLPAFKEAVSAITAHKKEQVSLKRTEERLTETFGDISLPLDTIFATWWNREGDRNAQTATRQLVEAVVSLPPYVTSAAYSLSQFKSLLKCQELSDQVTHLANEEQKLGTEKPPALDVPNFPVYDALMDKYFDNIQDIAQVNIAVARVADIYALVVEKFKLYTEYATLRSGEAAHIQAAKRLPIAAATASELAAKLAEYELQMVRHTHLESLLPWLRMGEEIKEHTSTVKDLSEMVVELRKQYEVAHFLEASMIQDSMQMLIKNINDVLSTIFTTPAYVDFSSTTTTKTTNNTKVEYSLVLHYRGVVYSDLAALSDGETTRLALAVSIATAQMNAFPFFAVDESISTLEPELRQTVLGCIRTYLVDKAVVIILQDDMIGNFDQVWEVTTPCN
jgi:DNA repair exonuclease SbcCD ATPase subunit